MGGRVPNPRPVLIDGALYCGDNGRILHGRCSGASARYSGVDLSGVPVLEVTLFDAVEHERDFGVTLRCEACGGGLEA